MTKFCKNCNCATDRYASGACKTCAQRSIDRWRAANKDKYAASVKAWYVANKAKVLAQVAAYQVDNKHRITATKAAYRAANPDVILIIRHNRRARKRANVGKLSRGLSDKLFKLQRGKCACCGEPLGDNYHLDHIMPLALGGTNTDENIQLLRATCNLQKNAKHPIEFMQSKGYLL